MTETIVRSLAELPGNQNAVTIGSFDGVHRGHRFLFDRVIKMAREHDVSSLVVTFDPLPAEVLRPDKAPPRLCTLEERTDEILAAGIDQVVVLEFNEQLQSQSADDFLDAVLKHAKPVGITVGEDFAFGHKRQGTPEFLRGRAAQDGFELEIVQRMNPDGVELSSSAVRRALVEDGNVRLAERILGRKYRLAGEVENGDHRGRDLGYPTANLRMTDRLTIPADGIYAAFVNNEQVGIGRPALVYVGTRPTFGQSNRLVEVFLLEYAGDLYGEQMSVEFVERIREDRAFDSAGELVEQMKRDEETGRQIFSELGISLPTTGN